METLLDVNKNTKKSSGSHAVSGVVRSKRPSCEAYYHIKGNWATYYKYSSYNVNTACLIISSIDRIINWKYLVTVMIGAAKLSSFDVPLIPVVRPREETSRLNASVVLSWVIKCWSWLVHIKLLIFYNKLMHHLCETGRKCSVCVCLYFNIHV